MKRESLAGSFFGTIVVYILCAIIVAAGWQSWRDILPAMVGALVVTVYDFWKAYRFDARAKA